MKKALALAGVTMLASTGLVVTATSASAAPSPKPGPSLLAAADTALRQHPEAVHSSAKDDFTVYSGTTDAAGRGVVRYTRTYAGLRVYGGDVIIRTGVDGGFSGSSVGLGAPLRLDTSPTYSAAEARDEATATFKGKVTATSGPELFVDASTGTGRLAWAMAAPAI